LQSVILDLVQSALIMSRRKPQKQNAQSAALVVIGAGLILIGLVAFMSWPRDSIPVQPDKTTNRTLPVVVEYDAPDLTLMDISGTQHSLAEYRGQVVLVNLWATWCPPCKAEMPTLQAFYEDHASQGYVTVAISDGDPQPDVREFVQVYGLSFPVWLDPTYIATDKAFKTRNLPSSFVIDRDGKIRLRWVGEIDRATLEEYVTPLILEP
jgi:cytochrome c biogenesis protein CcmG, thiol:disulfide interchange protein DsbE